MRVTRHSKWLFPLTKCIKEGLKDTCVPVILYSNTYLFFSVWQQLMGTCLETCLESSYASTVQWPGICLAWVTRWTFTLPSSMGTHCWTAATAPTSSACSPPRSLQLRWSRKQQESGCWPARSVTTCRVGHVTWPSTSVWPLTSLFWHCWVADREECLFVIPVF